MAVTAGFEHFVEQWGYLAILAGTLLEGETVVIAGGTMAQRGVLSFSMVMTVAFLGTLFADNLWFFIGRKFGTPLLRRSEKWRTRTDRISNLIQKFGIVFVLGYRFIYGIRTVTPVFLGATGYPHLKFFALDIISCAVWAIAFSWIGWGISTGLTSLLNRPGHLTEIIIAVVAASLLLWLATHEIGKRRRRQKLLALGGDGVSDAVSASALAPGLDLGVASDVASISKPQSAIPVAETKKSGRKED